MGPSPVEQNLQERRDSSHDDSGEDDSSWHIGYEGELRGIGIGEYLDDSRDHMRDTDSDLCDDDSRDCYIGYQTLPTSDSSFEIDCNCANEMFRRDFEEALNSASSVHSKNCDFKIDHKPQQIDLTEDKIEKIKTAMSAFTLPAPSWAKEIDSDHELKKLLEKLEEKKELHCIHDCFSNKIL